MNTEDNRSNNEKAWAIASDPSAKEKQWMAACTLIDGQKAPSSSRQFLHPSLGLPWSLSVSGLSGLGAFMIFGFLSAAVCELAAITTGVFYTFNGAHAFALLSAAFIAFSSIFSFQQHIWGGGRAWSIFHYAIVAFGALLPFSLELCLSPSASIGNLSLFALWSAGFIGLSAVSSKLTARTIQSLESTVGARRVFPHSRLIFAASGTLLLTLTAFPPIFTVFSAMCFWLPILLITSGYYIATVNKASDSQTASALAICAWGPLILANIVLVPALLINSACALFVPVLQISLSEFAVGFGTILCLILGPMIGARLGARMLRKTSMDSCEPIPLACARNMIDRQE